MSEEEKKQSTGNRLPNTGNESVNELHKPSTIILPTGQAGNEPSTNMEVHAQDLHKAPGHGWKHYFFEFFMLFLAVFCGFLAENIREHQVENAREKEFIKSMVEDLKDDHQNLGLYINELQLNLQQMDTMVTILGSDSLLKNNMDQLYYLARISPRLNIFTNNSRTLDQLKNSGSFRLIRNTDASNKIMTYYNGFNFTRHLENLYFEEFSEYKKIASTIFDPTILRKMEQQDGNISRHVVRPTLFSNMPASLNQLGVYAVYMNGSRRSIIPAAKSLQKTGDKLIAFLQKEYHLE